MKPFEQAALRRLSHDLRGSVASLRIGLQAVIDSPEMLNDLSGALLEEVEKLDYRMIQVHWMSRSAYPQMRSFDLGAWLSEQSGQSFPKFMIEGDSDLLQAAWKAAVHNAQTHGGGLGELKLSATDQGWSLLMTSPNDWPEGLADWLHYEPTALWRGKLCLGLPLQKSVMAAHGGRISIRPEGLVWEVA